MSDEKQRERRTNRTTRWSDIEWGKVGARAKCMGMTRGAYLRHLAQRDCDRAAAGTEDNR
jgi:hypothetical protein